MDKPKVHPTQKPIALLEYLIKTYSNEGDIVLDNCMGSGTTGVACRNLNRKFYGIEKDKRYFDIAKERIYAT
jgi:site-specific DNA-methyltransferase (adenine-specific)